MADREKRKDLSHDGLGDLSWHPEKVQESLRAIQDYAINIAREAIKWYNQSKRPKKRGAIIFRGLSIGLIAVGGIYPVIIASFSKQLGEIWGSPVWSTISIGLAGALIAYDRFFGFTSGWIRYINTELLLIKKLKEFQFECEKDRSDWQDQPPSKEQIQGFVEKAKKLSNLVNGLVIEETKAWTNEFQRVIKDFDKTVEKYLSDNPGT